MISKLIAAFTRDHSFETIADAKDTKDGFYIDVTFTKGRVREKDYAQCVANTISLARITAFLRYTGQTLMETRHTVTKRNDGYRVAISFHTAI